MHGLYQTKQISKERKIYNSKANFRCLLANKCNHYTYLRGLTGGVCRPLLLHIVAPLSRLLSLSSLLKAAHVLSWQNVHIFLHFFYPLLPIFSPPHIPLSLPVRHSYLVQTRKIINYVFHIAYMTSHICWYTFLSSDFGFN